MNTTQRAQGSRQPVATPVEAARPARLKTGRGAIHAGATWLTRLIVPAVLIAGWEAFSRSGAIPQSLLPAPSRVIVTLIDWIFGTNGISGSYGGTWGPNAVASLGRVLAGYVIAAVSGVVLGVAIGWWRWIERTMEPTLQLLRPVPPVSWIPLAIIWFGIANKPAIFLVFLGAFFPILMNTIHGVKNTDRQLIRAASMMGASQSQMLRFVVLPASLPSIFAGLRIAIGSAWMLTVTAEMVAVKSGLGYALWDSYYFLRYDLVIGAMISIGVLGYLSDVLMREVMARVLHWQRRGAVRQH
ncbi:ABC transporter permease [Robbsia andropogonis]|uniref:ABC transporter permease n=1 Tax=Robbsia andropogonis TaxID=28092 RepID=UPI0009E5B9F8|nr:ABC transporter permease [Robbsia andropogonis]